MSFLEEIQGSLFENYQINGTKYLKNSRPIATDILEELLQCAGEIYLSSIPKYVTAEDIMATACLLGEVYVIRFKVNFAGQSRGFAYIQYTNPGLMNLAIQRLPSILSMNGLGQIRVRQSRNCSKLVLRYVRDMTPQAVEQKLRTIVNFRQIGVRLVKGGKYEYEIVFKSNEDAVQARRIIGSNIYSFGRAAMITWDQGSGKRVR